MALPLCAVPDGSKRTSESVPPAGGAGVTSMQAALEAKRAAGGKCLVPYLKNNQLWICPTSGGRGGTMSAMTYNGRTFPVSPNYGWNSSLAAVAMAALTVPADIAAIADCSHPIWASHVGRIAWANSGDGVLYPYGGFDSAYYMSDKFSRHNGGENIAFADGHAKWMASTAIWGAGNAVMITVH